MGLCDVVAVATIASLVNASVETCTLVDSRCSLRSAVGNETAAVVKASAAIDMRLPLADSAPSTNTV
jgi:hypothetical protein